MTRNCGDAYGLDIMGLIGLLLCREQIKRYCGRQLTPFDVNKQVEMAEEISTDDAVGDIRNHKDLLECALTSKV